MRNHTYQPKTYRRIVLAPAAGHYHTFKAAKANAAPTDTLIIFHPIDGWIAHAGIAYPATYTVVSKRLPDGKWERRRDALPQGAV